MNSTVIPAWLAYAGFGLLNLVAVAGLLGALRPAALVWLALCVVSARATRGYVAYRASLELDDASEPDLEIYQPDRSTGW